MKTKILENISKGGYIKKTFLKNNDLTTEECYKIVFGIGNCKYCGNTAVFSNWLKGYNETCVSNECKKKLRKERTEKTNLEKYGVEYTFQSQDFQEYIRTCNINKYGVENNMFRGDVKEKHAESCIIRDIKRKEDIDENGLNSFHRAMVKSKETNIKNGYWVSDENKTDFEIYYAEVWKYTRRNDLSNLEHIEKRGHANQGKFHLDHKYSIFQGFKEGVSPAIIGSIYNLEMITGRNNLSKGRKCSIDINTLLEKYYGEE